MTIPETLKQLRTESGWYVGDKRAAEVLEAYARDLREQLAAMTTAREDAVQAAHMIHENALPDLATTLLEQVQQKIDEIKPDLGRGQCKDDYEHGHRNGAFFVLVELRRALKEEMETHRETPST